MCVHGSSEHQTWIYMQWNSNYYSKALLIQNKSRYVRERVPLLANPGKAFLGFCPHLPIHPLLYPLGLQFLKPCLWKWKFLWFSQIRSTAFFLFLGLILAYSYSSSIHHSLREQKRVRDFTGSVKFLATMRSCLVLASYGRRKHILASTKDGNGHIFSITLI